MTEPKRYLILADKDGLPSISIDDGAAWDSAMALADHLLATADDFDETMTAINASVAEHGPVSVFILSYTLALMTNGTSNNPLSRTNPVN